MIIKSYTDTLSEHNKNYRDREDLPPPLIRKCMKRVLIPPGMLIFFMASSPLGIVRQGLPS